MASALVVVAVVGITAAATSGPAYACGPTGCSVTSIGLPTRPTIPANPPLPTYPPPISVSIVGDSYFSGEGTGGPNHLYAPGPGGTVDWRHQSGYATPVLAWDYLELGRKKIFPAMTVNSDTIPTSWGLDKLHFAASSGATTSDLTNSQVDPADSSVIRSAPQRDGEDPLSNLVMFEFGGNDAHFSTLFETALNAYFGGKLIGLPAGTTTAWRNLQLSKVQQQVQSLLATMPTVRANIANALAQQWERTPNAQIVVSLYPQGVKSSGNADIPFIAGPTLDAMAPFASALNTAIRQGVADFQAAHPNGAPIVRVFDPNTAGPNGTNVVAGHELGQPNSYFNPLDPNLAELYQGHLFHGLQESFHPNAYGTVAMGMALATFVHNQYPDMFPDAPDFADVHTNPTAFVDNPNTDAQFEAWVNTNLEEICQGPGSLTMCTADPQTGPIGGGDDPANGGYIGGGGWGTDLETFLFEVWTYQQAEAAGQTPSQGPATWWYVQDPSGAWYYQWIDTNGDVQTDPQPPGWQPGPGQPLSSDAGIVAADGDGDGIGDAGGGGDTGSGGTGDTGGDTGGGGGGGGGFGGGGDGGGGGGGGTDPCDPAQAESYSIGSAATVLAAYVVPVADECDPDPL